MNMSVKEVPYFVWVACLFLALLSLLPVSISLKEVRSMETGCKTYWMYSGGDLNLDYDIRKVQSPLLFAFPSSVGYSAAIDGSTMRTELRFAKTVQREYFLESDYGGALEKPLRVGSDGVDSGAFVMGEPAYRLMWGSDGDQSVVMSDNLQSRWVASSFELPGEVEGSFLIRAQVEVSERGRVKHLFVESPIENEAWNQAVVRALYAVQFESGLRESGWIEVRSRAAKEMP